VIARLSCGGVSRVMHEPAQEPTERDPLESAQPTISRRDKPDALRPDTDDRPDRKLPPDQEDAGATTGDSPDSPRPTESPAGRD
jgi:hypothetical protein